MSTFNDRLKECRKKTGVSQEDAAKCLEIAYSTYRRYEQGGTEPTISEAARMAEFFGVSLDYLTGRKDERE